MSDRDKLITWIVIGSIILWIVILNVDPNFFMRFKLENLEKSLSFQQPFIPQSQPSPQTQGAPTPTSAPPKIATKPTKFTIRLSGDIEMIDGDKVLFIYVWNYGPSKQKFYFSKMWTDTSCLIYKAPPISFNLDPNEKSSIRYPLKCNIQSKVYLVIYTFDQKDYEVVEVKVR